MFRHVLSLLAVALLAACEAIPPAPAALEPARMETAGPVPMQDLAVQAGALSVEGTPQAAALSVPPQLAAPCACAAPADTAGVVTPPRVLVRREASRPVFRGVPNSAGVPRLNVDQAIRMVNDYRRQFELSPVRLEPRLTVAARNHAQDLAAFDRVSHTGSDGSTLQVRLQRAGYDAYAAAENISGGQRTFEDAFRAWRMSPVHREKLLAEHAQDIGIAYVYDPAAEYRVFWALIIAEQF
ncbi:MAG: CAP domain-containing protein [Aquisalinus sp.]|nr:CAP domain-containing protein [Aquisalinus sp.]